MVVVFNILPKLMNISKWSMVLSAVMVFLFNRPLPKTLNSPSGRLSSNHCSSQCIRYIFTLFMKTIGILFHGFITLHLGNHRHTFDFFIAFDTVYLRLESLYDFSTIQPSAVKWRHQTLFTTTFYLGDTEPLYGTEGMQDWNYIQNLVFLPKNGLPCWIGLPFSRWSFPLWKEE